MPASYVLQNFSRRQPRKQSPHKIEEILYGGESLHVTFFDAVPQALTSASNSRAASKCDSGNSNKIDHSSHGSGGQNTFSAYLRRSVSVQERRGRGHLRWQGQEPAQPRRVLLP